MRRISCVDAVDGKGTICHCAGGQAKTRAQEQSAERAAQANKMPPYTPEQLAELRAKCVPLHQHNCRRLGEQTGSVAAA
jgi:hypothetical protein